MDSLSPPTDTRTALVGLSRSELTEAVAALGEKPLDRKSVV